MVPTYVSVGLSNTVDFLRCMAWAIVEDQERRNLECAGNFFIRILNPMTTVERRERSANLIGPNLDLIGKNSYK